MSRSPSNRPHKALLLVFECFVLSALIAGSAIGHTPWEQRTPFHALSRTTAPLQITSIAGTGSATGLDVTFRNRSNRSVGVDVQAGTTLLNPSSGAQNMIVGRDQSFEIPGNSKSTEHLDAYCIQHDLDAPSGSSASWRIRPPKSNDSRIRLLRAVKAIDSEGSEMEKSAIQMAMWRVTDRISRTAAIDSLKFNGISDADAQAIIHSANVALKRAKLDPFPNRRSRR